MRRLTSCENENRGLKCVSDVGLRRYWYTKISLFSKTRVATRLSLYFASLSLTRDAITLRYRSTTYSTTSVVLPYSSTGRRRYAIVRRALMYTTGTRYVGRAGNIRRWYRNEAMLVQDFKKGIRK